MRRGQLEAVLGEPGPGAQGGPVDPVPVRVCGCRVVGGGGRQAGAGELVVEPGEQGVEADGDRDPGAGAVGVGGQVGGQGVLGQADQGVPESGAVVARVPWPWAVRAVAGGRVGWRPRDRCGEREEGGLEGGGVLEGAAAAEAYAAGAVLGDREVAAQVRGPVGAVEGFLGVAVGAVGVDHLEEVAGGPGQVGGVEPAGRLEQHRLPAFAQRVVVRAACRWRRRSPRPVRGTRRLRAAPHGWRGAHRPGGRIGVRCGTRRCGGCRPGGCTSPRWSPTPGGSSRSSGRRSRPAPRPPARPPGSAGSRAPRRCRPARPGSWPPTAPRPGCRAARPRRRPPRPG